MWSSVGHTGRDRLVTDKLIKKQPFRDVVAGTFSFFKEVVNTGGELSKTTVDSTHGLFETLAVKNGKK